MNLFGWDFMYATRLNIVNDKFKANSAHLASSFEFTATDKVFQSDVSIKGKFGTWSLSAIKSNKLIRVDIPVEHILIKGIPAGDLEERNIMVSIEVDLVFVSGKSEESVQNLVFDFRSNGSSGSSSVMSVIEVKDMEGKVITDLSSSLYLATAVLSCLKSHPDQLNYVFASFIQADEKAQWLMPNTSSFVLATTEAGESYFCIYGSKYSAGTPGQVDARIFDDSDDMYFILDGNSFLYNILGPGLEKTIPGISLGRTNIGMAIQGLKVKYPITELAYMIIQINGDKIRATPSGNYEAHMTVMGKMMSLNVPFTAPCDYDLKLFGPLQKFILTREPLMIDDPQHSDLPGYSVSTAANALFDQIGANWSFLLNFDPLNWSHLNFSKINAVGVANNFYVRGYAE